MTPAARVRREFRLGRPPRTLADHEQMEPLHPTVVWRRANEAISSFRERMVGAKLNPRHVEGAIIFVEQSAPEEPRFLALEERGKTPGQMEVAAFEVLSRPDVLALGMICAQHDDGAKQRAIFPYLFFSLNKRGMDVLKKAAAMQYAVVEMLKDAN